MSEDTAPRRNDPRIGLSLQLHRQLIIELADQVVRAVQAMPQDSRQSGDDSRLDDVWEEYKDQVQHEQYVMFDLYEYEIRRLCIVVLDGISEIERRFLWLWGEGYDRQDDERHDGITLEDWRPESVVDELFSEVNAVAVNEPLSCDLEDDVADLQPDGLPKESLVDFDALPDGWITDAMNSPATRFLTEVDLDSFVPDLCEDYYELLVQHGLALPWEFGGDPRDLTWIAECRKRVDQDFRAYFAEWTSCAAEPLAQWVGQRRTQARD